MAACVAAVIASFMGLLLSGAGHPAWKAFAKYFWLERRVGRGAGVPKYSEGHVFSYFLHSGGHVLAPVFLVGLMVLCLACLVNRDAVYGILSPHLCDVWASGCVRVWTWGDSLYRKWFFRVNYHSLCKATAHFCLIRPSVAASIPEVR